LPEGALRIAARSGAVVHRDAPLSSVNSRDRLEIRKPPALFARGLTVEVVLKERNDARPQSIPLPAIPLEISAFQRWALIFDSRIFRFRPVTGRAAIVFFASVLPVRGFFPCRRIQSLYCSSVEHFREAFSGRPFS
jgi:hypothetical protein